jgi:hypothetical protein
MSDPRWGTFLTSRPTQTQCLGVIREYNHLLAQLPLPDEVILGVILEVHPCYDNVKGRNWYHGVYLRLDDRAKVALSLLSNSGPIQGMPMLTEL